VKVKHASKGPEIMAHIKESTMALDMDQLNAFVGRFVGDLGATVHAGMVVIGAWISWPIWLMLVRLFLPARTAGALLEWQKSLAGPVHRLGQE